MVKLNPRKSCLYVQQKDIWKRSRRRLATGWWYMPSWNSILSKWVLANDLIGAVFIVTPESRNVRPSWASNACNRLHWDLRGTWHGSSSAQTGDRISSRGKEDVVWWAMGIQGANLPPLSLEVKRFERVEGSESFWVIVDSWTTLLFLWLTRSTNGWYKLTYSLDIWSSITHSSIHYPFLQELRLIDLMTHNGARKHFYQSFPHVVASHSPWNFFALSHV